MKKSQLYAGGVVYNERIPDGRHGICPRERALMTNRMRFLPLAALLASAAVPQAQTPLTIPNGLPDWAFNIPDKVQPPRVEATGPIRLPGQQQGAGRQGGGEQRHPSGLVSG